jgi:hypothetical protein
MLELMEREIRIGEITPPQDSPCTATTLTIKHPVNGTIIYSYDAVNKTITRKRGALAVETLSSREVAVNRLNFCVIGSNPTDDQQARVGIVMQLQNKAPKTANTIIFDVQTTVTSRDIVTEYQN